MGKVKNENHIVIHGWMLNELKLKGTELIIYACIYGFTQDEGQLFKGSLQYLADWTNSTKQNIMNNLKSLTEKGLIEKKENYINGVKFVEYYAKNLDGVVKKFGWGSQNFLPNNIEDNIDNISITDNNTNNINFNNNLELNNIYTYIENNFGRTLSPIEYNRIADWLNDFKEEIIKYAVELSVMQNAKNFKYVEAILNNWKSSGYKELEEIKKNDIKLKNKKEYSQDVFDYNWLDE